MAESKDVPPTTEKLATTAEVNEQLVQLLRAQMIGMNQPKKQPISAPTYDGTTDVDTFLQQFDSIAAHNNWESDESGLRLKLALRGEAAKCVMSDRAAEIRQQLLQKYGLRESQAYNMLKKLRYKPGEDLNVFINQLQKVLATAHPKLRGDELEAMAVKELLTQIPSNHPAMWALRVKPPTTVQDIKEIYDTFTNDNTNINYMNSETVDSTPNLAQTLLEGFQKQQQQQQEVLQEVLTLVREVRQPPTPVATAREEALPPVQERRTYSTTYQRPRRNFAPRAETRQCWRCQQIGHLARNCPYPPTPIHKTGNGPARR